MKNILLSASLFFTCLVMADSQKDSPYKTEKEIFSILKSTPDKAVQGPFLLKIQSISKSGFNTHLNTRKDPADPQNIVIDLPPFMTSYYTKQNKFKIEDTFLNQVLTVNGKLTKNTIVNPNNPNQKQTIHTIKVFLANQLAHYQ